MDRPLAASVPRIGGRLVVALLPLAALAVMRALPPSLTGSPLPWVPQAFAATTAVVAGLALLAAVWVSLTGGRVRDFGDAAALGMLAATFATVALESAGSLGPSIGVAASAFAATVGSVVGLRALPSVRGRGLGVVAAASAAEVCLAAILLFGATAAPDLSDLLFVTAAIGFATAALLSLDEPMRATAIGMAAAAATVLLLAGTNESQRLLGVAGFAGSAALGGWSLAAQRLRRVPTPMAVPVLDNFEPEYDELARLTRELRATIDDLIAARHTIDLQRTEIARMAELDQLTGVLGRGPTLQRVEVEAAEARRYAHPVALVLVDIDAFAELNHEHGLPIGDAILQEMALRLRLRTREADALGRIGGNTFAAVLPHTDEAGAAAFARAVFDRLFERPFTTDDGELTVFASVGVALMRPGMTLTGEDLLAAAEEALASAKAAGGNRIAFDRLHGLARLDERRDPESGLGAERASG